MSEISGQCQNTKIELKTLAREKRHEKRKYIGERMGGDN